MRRTRPCSSVHRARVLAVADIVIPGHGEAFRVDAADSGSALAHVARMFSRT